MEWRFDERRLSELIKAQKETVGLNKAALLRGSEMGPRGDVPTVADAGIDKKLSMRAQRVAAIPDEEFEDIIGDWRSRIAFAARQIQKERGRRGATVTALVRP